MARTLRIDIDLSRSLRDDDTRALVRSLAEFDDVQLAGAIGNCSAADQDRVLMLLPAVRRSEVFGQLRPEVAGEILGRIAPEEGAALLEEQDADDAADILGELDPARLREILARFDPEDIEELNELLAYDEDSAGGIMSPHFVHIEPDGTIAELFEIIRALEDPPSQIFYSYVLDDDDRLLGIISLRALVLADPSLRVRQVMKRDVISVTPDADQELVADIASRYDLTAVPVVDAERRMLGVVTIDDIVDVLTEEATEDILKMAGAGEEIIDTQSFGSSFRARVPWLAAAAAGGVLVAAALSGFEGALQSVPVLALFMPVVAGMGGNVGTQSSTIVVRGLAVGYVERGRLASIVGREVGLGATLGLIYGIAIALAAPFVGGEVSDPLALGLVLTFGMIGSMTIAATVGASIPLLMDRLKIDPAVSTGPFVTTAVDILGLLFYFWLATVLLGVSP